MKLFVDISGYKPVLATLCLIDCGQSAVSCALGDLCHGFTPLINQKIMDSLQVKYFKPHSLQVLGIVYATMSFLSFNVAVYNDSVAYLKMFI